MAVFSFPSVGLTGPCPVGQPRVLVKNVSCIEFFVPAFYIDSLKDSRWKKEKRIKKKRREGYGKGMPGHDFIAGWIC
jgi:hypothetical protein